MVRLKVESAYPRTIVHRENSPAVGRSSHARLGGATPLVREGNYRLRGPWKDRRGFDSIVQCVSGMADAQGAGGAPKLLPCSAIDYVSGYLMAFGAMVALARVGKWIVDRGAADPAKAVEPEAATMETRSPVGVITHLKPVVQLSETPPFWARPPVQLGFHRAEWP